LEVELELENQCEKIAFRFAELLICVGGSMISGTNGTGADSGNWWVTWCFGLNGAGLLLSSHADQILRRPLNPQGDAALKRELDVQQKRRRDIFIV
jgi:hypothetical protein